MSRVYKDVLVHDTRGNHQGQVTDTETATGRTGDGQRKDKDGERGVRVDVRICTKVYLSSPSPLHLTTTSGLLKSWSTKPFVSFGRFSSKLDSVGPR